MKEQESISLSAYFSGELRELLAGLAEFSSRRKERVGLVGGPVRDLLLGKSLRELDLLVEGKAIPFARDFVRAWRNLLPAFPVPAVGPEFASFGTIKLRFPEPLLEGLVEVDFASARKERYPRPGRAPEVKYPCSIEEDLSRRDFSVNALVYLLRPGEKLELLDQFSGQEDLRNAQLRVLHEQSFIDDPARMIRGLRFEVRFGLGWESKTRTLFEEARERSLLQTLTPQRRFDELRKAFREPDALTVLRRLAEERLLEQFHPQMQFDESALQGINEMPPDSIRQARISGSLLATLDDESYVALLKDWGLSKKLAAEFLQVRSDVA